MLLVSCAGGLSAAKSEFRDGDYGAAREHLEALESREASWPEADRATYALYRGLVYHALGDRPRAAQWLGRARSLEDARPHVLSPDDQTRLGLALDALGDAVAD